MRFEEAEHPVFFHLRADRRRDHADPDMAQVKEMGGHQKCTLLIIFRDHHDVFMRLSRSHQHNRYMVRQETL